MAFSNSFIQSKSPLLSLAKVQYEEDIHFVYENVSFTSIEYETSGPMIELNHQIPNNVEFKNSQFEDIKNGYIWIATPDRNTQSISTQVDFVNVSANNIYETSTSFILVEEEAKLNIYESSFTNAISLSDGGVISGGSSNTQTVIENSKFMNNSARNGAVFSVSVQSFIKCKT